MRGNVLLHRPLLAKGQVVAGLALNAGQLDVDAALGFGDGAQGHVTGPEAGRVEPGFLYRVLQAIQRQLVHLGQRWGVDRGGDAVVADRRFQRDDVLRRNVSVMAEHTQVEPVFLRFVPEFNLGALVVWAAPELAGAPVGDSGVLFEQRVADGFADVVPVGFLAAGEAAQVLLLFLGPRFGHGDIRLNVDGVNIDFRYEVGRGLPDAVAVVVVAQHDRALLPHVALGHAWLAHRRPDDGEGKLAGLRGCWRGRDRVLRGCWEGRFC